jgi:hypothetical protein
MLRVLSSRKAPPIGSAVNSMRRGGLLIGCVVGAVLLTIFTVPFFRYRKSYVAFEVPKDAVLRAYIPSALTSEAKAASPDPELSFVFGKLTYRRMLFQEDVPVSAAYVVVNRKELLSSGKTAARSYVLWQTANDGYIGNVVQPTIIQTYHPIDVILIKREGNKCLLDVQCTKHDPLPLSGERWYELE